MCLVVSIKTLSLYGQYFSLAPCFLIVLRTVNLPASPLVIRRFFNKKNSLSKAPISETNEGTF
jgi:hypothetical protein